MMKKINLSGFLLLFVLLLAALPMRAAITLVQHPAAGKDCVSGATCALAFASNPAANNLLIVAVRVGGGTNITSLSVADTIVNSWTQLTPVNSTTGFRDTGWYAVNSTTAADTVTVSVTPNETIRMAIYEYSGTATSSPLDLQNTGSGSSTACASGSITPGAANELVFAFCGTGTSSTITAGNGNFTLEDQVPAGASLGRLGTEDWIQGAATATTGPLTLNVSGLWTANVAAFKAASGAIPPPGPNKRQKLEMLDQGLAMYIDELNIFLFQECSPVNSLCTQGITLCFDDGTCKDVTLSNKPVTVALWTQVAGARTVAPIGMLGPHAPPTPLIIDQVWQ
jgi:hypothetical protein